MTDVKSPETSDRSVLDDAGFGSGFGMGSGSMPRASAAGVGTPEVVPKQQGNKGLQRGNPRRRVAGQKPVEVGSAGPSAERSYSVATGLQFNDVDELTLNSCSRDHCNAILLELFSSVWKLRVDDATVMKKAEDVICALFATRTASPFADYDFLVMVGGKEVNTSAFSDLLADYEVSRRQFARGFADQIRSYIGDEDNVRLRGNIQSTLGVYHQYVDLAFDGSGGCKNLNRNEVAFVKSLEHSKLFDSSAVSDLKNSNILDGQFEQVGTSRRGVGA